MFSDIYFIVEIIFFLVKMIFFYSCELNISDFFMEILLFLSSSNQQHDE